MLKESDSSRKDTPTFFRTVDELPTGTREELRTETGVRAAASYVKVYDLLKHNLADIALTKLSYPTAGKLP